jgi:hypothetical protein
MRAAHLYADIVNLDDILGVTEAEGETCHRRTLRFLNLHGCVAMCVGIGGDDVSGG